MFMIQILLCRDVYSYEPLKVENTLHLDTAMECIRHWERTMQDYQAYVSRREDSISMVKMELFHKNPETRSWDYQQQWEHRLPLKKMTVINPELAEFRKTRPKLRPTKAYVEPIHNPVDVVFQEIQQ